MNKWNDVKNFVNSHDIFTRKELKKESLSDNTVDNYINYIIKAGFIDRIGRGKYKLLIKIPKYISSSIIFVLAYNEEKRTKLMTSLIRKQKLENIGGSL